MCPRQSMGNRWRPAATLSDPERLDGPFGHRRLEVHDWVSLVAPRAKGLGPLHADEERIVGHPVRGADAKAAERLPGLDVDKPGITIW